MMNYCPICFEEFETQAEPQPDQDIESKGDLLNQPSVDVSEESTPFCDHEFCHECLFEYCVYFIHSLQHVPIPCPMNACHAVSLKAKQYFETIGSSAQVKTLRQEKVNPGELTLSNDTTCQNVLTDAFVQFVLNKYKQLLLKQQITQNEKSNPSHGINLHRLLRLNDSFIGGSISSVLKSTSESSLLLYQDTEKDEGISRDIEQGKVIRSKNEIVAKISSLPATENKKESIPAIDETKTDVDCDIDECEDKLLRSGLDSWRRYQTLNLLMLNSHSSNSRSRASSSSQDETDDVCPKYVECPRCNEAVPYNTKRNVNIKDNRQDNIDSNNNDLQPPNAVSCLSCEHIFCRLHGDAHNVMTVSCLAYTSSPDYVSSLECIRRHTKPCPHCGAPIEKVSGCDHVVCVACGGHMYYNSGRKYYNSVGLRNNEGSNDEVRNEQARNDEENNESFDVRIYCATVIGFPCLIFFFWFYFFLMFSGIILGLILDCILITFQSIFCPVCHENRLHDALNNRIIRTILVTILSFKFFPFTIIPGFLLVNGLILLLNFGDHYEYLKERFHQLLTRMSPLQSHPHGSGPTSPHHEDHDDEWVQI